MRFIFVPLPFLLSACGGPSEVLDPWPFRPPTITLSCERTKLAGVVVRRVFVTTPDGKRYAANGSARAVAPPTDEIQSHYDVSKVISRGLDLCQQDRGPIELNAPVRKPSPPTLSKSAQVEHSPLGSTFFTLEADAVVDQRRPHLSIVCEARKRPSLQIQTVRAPAIPPALRGVYFSISAPSIGERKVEVSWLPEDVWMPRESEKDIARLVAKALAAGESVEVALPDDLGLPATIVWSASQLQPHLPKMRKLCKFT